jgi:hypothetical protein
VQWRHDEVVPLPIPAFDPPDQPSQPLHIVGLKLDEHKTSRGAGSTRKAAAVGTIDLDKEESVIWDMGARFQILFDAGTAKSRSQGSRERGGTSPSAPLANGRKTDHPNPSTQTDINYAIIYCTRASNVSTSSLRSRHLVWFE